MTAPQDPATVADSADRVTDAAEAAPAPPLWRQGAVALLAIAVIAALLSSPWSSGFAFFYMGVVPGIIALRLNWRIAAGSAVATAVAVLIGVWVSGSTAGAVIWLTLLALTIGYAARFGLATIASMITVQAAIVAISGNVFALAPDPYDVPHTFLAGLPVAGFTLAGGLTVTIGIAAFLRGWERAPSPKLERSDALWYGGVALALVVAAVWLAMAKFAGTHAWWLVLTILVVLLPTHDETVHRVHDRVLGTIAGAVLVMAVAVVTEADWVFYTLALVGAIGTIATASASYVLNSALLTVTVLGAASPAAHSALLLHGERVLLTVAGALIAYAAMIGAERLRALLARRHPAISPPPGPADRG